MDIMKITSFDRRTAKLISHEMLQALQPVAERYGLVVTDKGGKFGMHQFTPRFEMAVKSSEGQALTKEATDFKKLAFVHGLKPTDLGKGFLDDRGDMFEITGLKPKSGKYPIIARKIGSDSQYKFPARTVIEGLKRVSPLDDWRNREVK